jgi:hypothetical protein
MAKKFNNIYFEKKGRGKNSVTSAVVDIGSRGVRTAKEVGAIALAQLIDYLDRYTYDHYGNKVRFTNRKWAGRTKILYILANKYGGKKFVDLAQKLKKQYDKGKISKSEVVKTVKEIARKYKLPIVKFNI